MLDLPKHPLERKMKCPVCNADFVTIPIRRSAQPGDSSHIIEQHVCPTGHVYATEVGKSEMLAEY